MLAHAGSTINVYGPIGVTANYGRPTSSYTIDNLSTVEFTAPIVTGFDPLTSVLFFSASNLSSGQHTLIVNRIGTDNSTYFVDFIEYTPGEPGPPASSTSSPNPSGTPTSQFIGGSTTSVSVITASPTPNLDLPPQLTPSVG